MSDPLKDTFELLKKLGHFKDFKNYQEYRLIKFGEQETGKERLDAFLEQEPKKSQRDFKYVFES